MASYRYRAEIPAGCLGASLNDLSANLLVFAKPAHGDVEQAVASKKSGRKVVVDYCDDHFDDMSQQHYRLMLCLADAVTCPTAAMAARIKDLLYAGEVTVIHDPYEFPEEAPHCKGGRVLWFGHGSNFSSLLRVLPKIYAPLIVVSDLPMARPWSIETMYREFAAADIVIIPATAPYKSANRAVEAIRQGCFVVAEPHPSHNEFPGIWLGDIPEGIEWAVQNQSQANERTREAQNYVSSRFSPRTQASAWRSLFERMSSPCTSEAEKSTGQDGRTSTCTASVPMSNATCEPSISPEAA